jgi:hypothetical protein
VSAFSVLVFCTCDSNRTVHIRQNMFYEWLECVRWGPWKQRLIICAGMYEYFVYLWIRTCSNTWHFLLYTDPTTEQVSDLISAWHPAEGSVTFCHGIYCIKYIFQNL